MFRSIRRLFIFLCLAVVTILSTFFLLNHLQSGTVAAVGEIGTITGTVQPPQGVAVPISTTVALIKLDGAEEDMFFMETAANPIDGSFTFTDVPFDYYILIIIPPIESLLAPSAPLFFPLEELNHDAGIIHVGYTQIQGAVVAPDGITPVEAMLTAVDETSGVMMETHTMDGLYRFGGLLPGDYTLHAMPEEGPYWDTAPTSVTIGISNTHLLTLTLTTPDLWGYAVDAAGNPLPDTDVFIMNSTGEFYGDFTDGNGLWALGGLPDGNYKLEAAPPWHQNNLTPPEPVDVSIPGTTSPLTLTFAALGTGNKIVNGTVRTTSGAPVDDAIIFAHHMDMYYSISAETDVNGEFQLDLTPGQWSIMVEPKRDFNGMPVGDWIYAQMPQFVTFADNETPESIVVDFEVTEADAALAGQIKLPDGTVPQFEVAIDVFNSEGYGGHTMPNQVDGTFEMPLPAGGYELFIFPMSPEFEGPEMMPVHIEPGEMLDLGVITLVGQDAMITGQVMADGEPVSGFPITAWKEETGAFKQTETFPNGQYELPVSAGTWYVMPAFDHNQSYVYSGEGQEVEVDVGQTVTGINFDLVGTNSTIAGRIVDGAGNPLGEVHGWASVESIGQQNSQNGMPLHTGAPIINGRFDIQVPAGSYRIFIYLDDSGDYFAGQETTVTVATHETANVTIAVTSPDTTIMGHLVDKRTGNPVAGLEGFVWAWNEGKGTNTMTNPADGSYELNVVAGKWQVDHWVDDEQYMSLWQENSIEIGQGETAVVDLEVVRKDAVLSGRVLNPSGDPVPGSTVIIEGQDDLHGVWLFADTDATGTFTLEVPFGKFRLEATIGPSTWFAPESIMVEVGAGEQVDDIDLQFREASATLSGTLTALGANMDGPAFLWAWSEDGGHTSSTTFLTTNGQDATGTYSFGVVSGSTWHVGAVFENEMNFWFAEGTVTIEGSSATLDLELLPGGRMPDPKAITFDASEPLDLVLDDNTEIFIPAGAMPITGTVNLRIEPVASLPDQDHADVLNYGYQILATDGNGRPIEDNFNQDVTIYFSYDDTGMSNEDETHLKPAYFSTTTNQWTIPENFVIDVEANEVTLNINHFTDFAVVNNQATSTYSIFLPMMQK